MSRRFEVQVSETCREVRAHPQLSPCPQVPTPLLLVFTLEAEIYRTAVHTMHVPTRHFLSPSSIINDIFILGFLAATRVFLDRRTLNL